MTLLSILLALIAERAAPQLLLYRSFEWFADYMEWISENLSIHRMNANVLLAVVMIPLMLLCWMFDGLFDNALFGLFELTFNVLVLLFCLGPVDLNSLTERYLDAREADNAEEARQIEASLFIENVQPSAETDSIFTRFLLVQANSGIFAVLFWFALLGPVAALLYRLLEQSLRLKNLPEAVLPIRPAAQTLLGWMDWAPSRISMIAYLICGNFEAALRRWKNTTPGAVDLLEQNNEMLQTVGLAAIDAETEGQSAIEKVKKSRGLILRSLVVWVILLIPF